MNPLIETASAEAKFRKQIENDRNTATEKLKMYNDIEFTLMDLGRQLSEAASCYMYSKSIYLTVDNRDDLQKCLSIGPLWKKSNNGGGIKYSWTDLNGYNWEIQAKDAALPSTCKVEREKVYIPARDGYYEEREKIVCTLKPGISSVSNELDEPNTPATTDVPF